MVAEPRVIPVAPDSDLESILDEASTGDVVLVRGGRRFRISRDDDPFANYDAERVQQALDRSFGVLKGIDIERFLEELREQRGQDRFDRLDES